MDAAVTKCLDAIPREVERLDRSIELMFRAKPAEQPSTFDIGAMCERLKSLIAARAMRQRVEVVLELKRGPMEIVGFEDQVQSALMNVIVNALEAMPEQGRLVISAEGDATQRDCSHQRQRCRNTTSADGAPVAATFRERSTTDWDRLACDPCDRRIARRSHRMRVERPPRDVH